MALRRSVHCCYERLFHFLWYVRYCLQRAFVFCYLSHEVLVVKPLAFHSLLKYGVDIVEAADLDVLLEYQAVYRLYTRRTSGYLIPVEVPFVVLHGTAERQTPFCIERFVVERHRAAFFSHLKRFNFRPVVHELHELLHERPALFLVVRQAKIEKKICNAHYSKTDFSCSKRHVLYLLQWPLVDIYYVVKEARGCANGTAHAVPVDVSAPVVFLFGECPYIDRAKVARLIRAKQDFTARVRCYYWAQMIKERVELVHPVEKYYPGLRRLPRLVN